MKSPTFSSHRVSVELSHPPRNCPVRFQTLTAVVDTFAYANSVTTSSPQPFLPGDEYQPDTCSLKSVHQCSTTRYLTPWRDMRFRTDAVRARALLCISAEHSSLFSRSELLAATPVQRRRTGDWTYRWGFRGGFCRYNLLATQTARICAARAHPMSRFYKYGAHMQLPVLHIEVSGVVAHAFESPLFAIQIGVHAIRSENHAYLKQETANYENSQRAWPQLTAISLCDAHTGIGIAAP